jgi:SAM-dependent methyltransferase
MIASSASSLKPFLKGLLTFIPGVQRAFYDRTAGGHTASASYCYGVWLKHLALLREQGMAEVPRSVLEIGPGDSLGAGLAALISGAQEYAAVDTVRHAGVASTRAVMKELVALFQARAPRPVKGWPDFDACLDERLFPSRILTEKTLGHTLAPERLAALAFAVSRLDSQPQHQALRYATWADLATLGEPRADLIFSHVVLCVVDDLDRLYGRCAKWLKPGGWMSHQTAFDSLGVTREWNGHLRYSEAEWFAISGRRPFFVNRERLSTHLRLLDKHGFDVVSVLRQSAAGGIARAEMAPRWQGISDDDHACAGAFIISRKRR